MRLYGVTRYPSVADVKACHCCLAQSSTLSWPCNLVRLDHADERVHGSRVDDLLPGELKARKERQTFFRFGRLDISVILLFRMLLSRRIFVTMDMLHFSSKATGDDTPNYSK